MQKLLIFFSIFILSFVNLANANEIKILFKLENEIITNQDVIDELNYLVSLNNNLTSLEKNKLNQTKGILLHVYTNKHESCE